MGPGRGTSLYQGPETRFALADFEALVVYSLEPTWLSVPPPCPLSSLPEGPLLPQHQLVS